MGTTLDTDRGRRLHFVGIGGCGMSGLALIAHSLGATVTGSDRREGPYLANVRERRIEVAIGHAAELVAPGAELVYSGAVPPDNPERERAHRLGLREIRRGEFLAEVAALRRCIAISGTHGKTTTAAMTLHALRGDDAARTPWRGRGRRTRNRWGAGRHRHERRVGQRGVARGRDG
ncbi:MAG TPA: Mur ligase domain-containing protein [Solirubrobacteraceae bacterium]|nr:Mur ligase domain-containing protein [Solirubrobacteraceae bacterium]